MNDNPKSSSVTIMLTYLWPITIRESITFLQKRSDTFLSDMKEQKAIPPKRRYVLPFRHGTIPRTVVNTDRHNNLKSPCHILAKSGR
jgi:hypothetical protein